MENTLLTQILAEKQDFWNTSVLKIMVNLNLFKNLKSCKSLPEKQNFISFKEYINKSKNKYVVSFSKFMEILYY